MSDVIIVALIGFPPGLIASLAAWRNARAANRAVNNRPATEPSISDDVRAIRHQVGTIEEQLLEHLAWHERQH